MNAMVKLPRNGMKGRRPEKSGYFGFLSIAILCILLPSCVAQQADLDRFQREFDDRISKLDQDKQALEESLGQAEGMLVTQKSELEQLVKARAQINSELRNLRDESLTSLSGDLGTERHRIDQIHLRLDDQQQALDMSNQLIEQRDSQRAAEISALGLRFDDQMQQQDIATNKQMGEFRQSLSGFKEALRALGNQLDREVKRAGGAEKTLQQLVHEKHVAFEQKLNEDIQALRTYVEQDVTKSIQSLADTLKHTTANLDSQIQAQNLRLEEVNAQVDKKFQGVVRELHNTATDLQTTKGSLDQLKNVLDTSVSTIGQQLDDHSRRVGEIKKQVNRLGAATKRLELLDTTTKQLTQNTQQNLVQLQDQNQSIVQLRDALENAATKIGQQVDAYSQQVGAIRNQLKVLDGKDQQFEKSVAQLRTALGTTGSALGEGVEEQGKELVATQNRLSELEGLQGTLSQKLETDTQALRNYLEQDVKAGLGTVGQSIEQLREHLDQQVEQLHGVAKAVEQESHLTAKQVQQNHQQVQELNQATAKLQEAFNAIGGMLGQRVDGQLQQMGRLSEQISRLEQEQSAVREKLRSDTQSTSTHLSEVNTSVQSVTEALRQVETALSARVDELERRTAEPQQGSADLQEAKQEMAATIQHVNQLTGTMSQLREAIQSIGTKMGARVDQQAQQIAELAKKLKSLEGQRVTSTKK